VRSASTNPVPTLISGAIVNVTGAIPGGKISTTSQQGYYAASWGCSTQVYVGLTVDLSAASACKGLNPTPPGATGNYKSVAPNTPGRIRLRDPGLLKHALEAPHLHDLGSGRTRTRPESEGTGSHPTRAMMQKTRDNDRRPRYLERTSSFPCGCTVRQISRDAGETWFTVWATRRPCDLHVPRSSPRSAPG
jgi:hypothetical protein